MRRGNCSRRQWQGRRLVRSLSWGSTTRVGPDSRDLQRAKTVAAGRSETCLHGTSARVETSELKLRNSKLSQQKPEEKPRAILQSRSQRKLHNSITQWFVQTLVAGALACSIQALHTNTAYLNRHYEGEWNDHESSTRSEPWTKRSEVTEHQRVIQVRT